MNSSYQGGKISAEIKAKVSHMTKEEISALLKSAKVDSSILDKATYHELVWYEPNAIV